MSTPKLSGHWSTLVPISMPECFSGMQSTLAPECSCTKVLQCPVSFRVLIIFQNPQSAQSTLVVSSKVHCPTGLCSKKPPYPTVYLKCPTGVITSLAGKPHGHWKWTGPKYIVCSYLDVLQSFNFEVNFIFKLSGCIFREDASYIN